MRTNRFSAAAFAALLFAAYSPAQASISDRNALDSIFDKGGLPAIESLKAFADSGNVVPVGAASSKPIQGEEKKGSWVLDDPDNDLSNPGANPSRPEEQRFWDKLQAKTFDDICRKIRLPLGTDLKLSEYGAIGIDLKRSLRRYPHKELAVVDEVKLSVGLGHTEELFSIADEVPVNLGLSAGMEGRAYVIRPLGSEKSCKQLKKLLKVWEFKTVLPVKPERITDMKVGELWKLPLIFRIGIGPSAGYPVAPNVAISLSYGVSRQRVASVTLYRLNKDKLRLRLRIDRVNITNKSGEIRYTFPIGDWKMFEGGNLLEKELDRQAARQMKRYLKLALGAGGWKREGRKVLLEFVLDPKDPGQMEKVSDFLKGNLSVLKTLLKIANSAKHPIVREDGQAEYLAKLEKQYASKLERDIEFAGIDDYDHKGRNFYIMFPFLFNYNSNSGEQLDRIIAGDKDSQTLVNRAWKGSEGAFLDIPFLGEITKSNSRETVMTSIEIDKKGFPDAPILSYLRQEGFVRHTEQDARRMIEDVNGIMKYAGVRGVGTNPDMLLPVDSIIPLPEEEPKEEDPWNDDEDPFDAGPPSRFYRSAVSAFTMVFNKRAVTEMIWTPADTIIKAYVNSLPDDDRKVMETVYEHSTINKDGKMNLDKKALRKIFPYQHFIFDEDDDGYDVWDTIRDLSREAAKLAYDIAQARQGDWEERSKTLLKIISGKGKSRLGYDKIMKVLVQLVNPEDIYAEFTINTRKKIKGEEDVSSRYLLNKDNNDPILRKRTQLKERFSEPSLLVD